MDKQRIIEITDRIKEHYDFIQQVTKEVTTCGYGDATPIWHVLDKQDVIKMSEVLGLTPAIESIYYYIMFNGVKIFTVLWENGDGEE